MSQMPALTPTRSLPALPTERELSMIEKLALIEFKSGLLPKAIKTPEQAVTIALKAREIGIPMMYGFSHIFVVDGKPSISAELMLALAYRNIPGIQIQIKAESDSCEIRGTRPGGSTVAIRWSMMDAGAAGLLGKDNWRKYPRAMLRARAIAELARSLFPDALMGCSYCPEELNPDLKVSEEGEPIEVKNETPSGATQNLNEALGITEPDAKPPESSRLEPRALRSRADLNRYIMNHYIEFMKAKGPDFQVKAFMKENYQVDETRLMTVEQLNHFVMAMEKELKGK